MSWLLNQVKSDQIEIILEIHENFLWNNVKNYIVFKIKSDKIEISFEICSSKFNLETNKKTWQQQKVMWNMFDLFSDR